MLYKGLAKPVLFRMDPENAHHLLIGRLGAAGRVPGVTALLEALWGVPVKPEMAVTLWGLNFHSPVGLAAGLDKNAAAVPGFSSIGFGFMEVGTVTPKPQEGNEKPRMFRLPEDHALINRMGFNNVGTEEMAENLKKAGKRKIPLAINIGKNKLTPNEQAEDDYRICIRTLYAQGDFFVVNISSPNTPGLRNLQHGEELRNLLNAVKDEMKRQHDVLGGAEKPILVKIAPDLSEDELELTIDRIVASGVSGVIATNTTINRENLKNLHSSETGGISGRPLNGRTTEIIRSIYRQTGGKLPIIGSGGIFTARDAYDKIRAGASLVEIYTSLIYEGPAINRALHAGLLSLMKRDGFARITDAVGTAAR